jgi:uncharacterized protein (DUF885 family)
MLMNMITPAAKLQDLAERYWAFQREEFPIIAIQAGDAPTTDILVREAPEDYARRADWAEQILEELAAVGEDSLSLTERATRALLQHELELTVNVVARQGHLRRTLYPLGPDFTFNNWASATNLATADDARRYVARLAQVPTGFESVQASLLEGVGQGLRYPRIVVERALGIARAQASAQLDASPFARPLALLAGRGAAYQDIVAEGRAVIEQAVIPTLSSYADFIETVLLPVAREDLACTAEMDGEAFYAHLIREFTTTDLSPEAIHQIGLDEVRRITDAMLLVAADAGHSDDLPGFRRRLQADTSQILESAEALRQEIEILSKRIDARIPEFFGRMPRSTYGVSSIPAAIAPAMPPAYAQPNPADNSAAGIHWITSIPSKLPRYTHIPVALHEAWPGHLMHLALIQELDLPQFRRSGFLRYSVCLEGWALYCESLGEEMGFYDTPEKRYGRLETEMWRAVRLVVDTGIHAKNWSRDQAIAYFKDHLALPIETVEAEVDRYVGLPGQALSYQLGNLKIRELRTRAEQELGERFNIRSFHDALASPGAVSLEVLDQTVSAWIEAQHQ